MQKIISLMIAVILLGCAKSADSEAQLATSAEKDYIVVLDKRHVESVGIRQLRQNGLSLKAESLVAEALRDVDLDHDLRSSERVFSKVLKGGVYRLSGKEVKDLKNDSRIAYIEEDKVISISAVQDSAPWGLDRIDQINLPADKKYNYSQTADNVNAYVIDTGILAKHEEFGGRAMTGFDAVDGGEALDCNGHGTHVAGTVAGLNFGVAKGAKLIAVRVLDCYGSGKISSVISGVEWVTKNHVKPAVANMSLGGGLSQALDEAVKASINAGVVYVVAAGNENTLACNSSPARVAEAITVGATASNDSRSTFSNYGTCVTLFAPGTDITSSWISSSSSNKTISGTSMASPHVAGVVALYLAANPKATPAQVKAALIAGAVTGNLTQAGTGSPNLLLNTLFMTQGSAPVIAVPVLKSGVAVSALSDVKGGEKKFKIEVPANVTKLSVGISGGTGDADLYVRAGSEASTKLYDCRPYKSGNAESCQLTVKAGAVYHILVKAYSAYQGLSLKADF